MNRIYCSNCGHMIPGKSNYCRYCGAAQHGPESAVYHAAGKQLQVRALADVALDAADDISPDTETKSEARMADVEPRHLAPLSQISFFINYMIISSIVLLAVIVGLFLNPLLFSMILIAYVLTVYIITALVYNNFKFSINGTHFNKEYGILHKKHVTIPFEQIQNVNIRRSLLDQILGLASLDIESAGGTSTKPAEVIGGSRSLAEGHLPGLTLKDAREIHDLLLQRVAAAQ